MNCSSPGVGRPGSRAPECSTPDGAAPDFPMKLETCLNALDRELLAEATENFLPERVIDFHAHVMDARYYAPGTVNAALAGKTFGFDQYAEAMRLVLGHRLAVAFVFPYP